MAATEVDAKCPHCGTPIHVVIHRIEVESDDPDRIVFGLIDALKTRDTAPKAG